MKKTILLAFRMFLYVAFVSALSLSLVSCNPENSEELLPPNPEVSVPDGYENYFSKTIRFNRSAGEAKVVFQVNVDWTLEVIGTTMGTGNWCSIEPTSGLAGQHELLVRVPENKSYRPRSVSVFLCTSHGVNIAQFSIKQEADFENEAIDLGLSVKWASRNVGARYPKDAGNYYAWGETETKTTYYDRYNYKWYDRSSNYDYTKYCPDDKKTVLDLEDDVAHVLWGDGWRVPTKDEFQELIDECVWRLDNKTGEVGYEITGPNGNSIFLPAVGYQNSMGWCSGYDSLGYYWSSTSCAYIDAYYCSTGNYGDIANTNRCHGLTVRPVKE